MYLLLTKNATHHATSDTCSLCDIKYVDDIPGIYIGNTMVGTIENRIRNTNNIKIFNDIFEIYGIEGTLLGNNYKYTSVNGQDKTLEIRLDKMITDVHNHPGYNWGASFNGIELSQNDKGLVLLLFLDPLLCIQKIKHTITGSQAEDFFITLEYCINKKVANTNNSFLLLNKLRHILVDDVMDIVTELYVALLCREYTL